MVLVHTADLVLLAATRSVLRDEAVNVRVTSNVPLVTLPSDIMEPEQELLL